MKSVNKRKNYLVDRKLQTRFIATFVISILVALFLFTAGSFAYFWAASMAGDNLFKEFITIDKQVFEEREVETNGQVSTVRYPTTKTIRGVRRWEIVFPPILINNLIILVVISIIGIFYSHRLVGPVYRMTADLKRILAGKGSRKIKLRKGDKFVELAETINKLIEQTDSRSQNGGDE